jgi:uncharacterized membrane protein YeiB
MFLHLLDTSMGWNVDLVFAMERWFQMAQAAILGAALCWWYSHGRFRIAFQSLEHIGRMTLTNYLVQNIVALWLFSGVGLGLLHRTSYAFAFAVVELLPIRSSRMAVAFFGVQALVAKQINVAE